METSPSWPAIQLLWQLVALQLTVYGALWWAVALNQTSSRAALRLFGCFNWLLAADLFLVGLRSPGEVELLTRVLANLFAISAFVCLWQGGVSRLDVRYSVKEPLAVAGVAAVFIVALGLIPGHGLWRAAVVQLAIAWLIMRAWWVARHHFAERHGKHSSVLLGILACIIVTALVAKALGGILLGWTIEFDQQHPGALFTVFLISALTTFLNCLLAYTEIKGLLARFQQLALQDPLTLIANRRAFNDQLDVCWAGWLRSHTEFWVLCLDIDHFKAVNDRFGHQVGDSVLVAVTQALRAQIRVGDVLARTGGEEFTLLVTSTSASDVAELAERLRLAVSRHVTTPDGAEVHISAGVACCERTDENPGETVARADNALYRAKANGRNTVVMVARASSLQRAAA